MEATIVAVHFTLSTHPMLQASNKARLVSGPAVGEVEENGRREPGNFLPPETWSLSAGTFVVPAN